MKLEMKPRGINKLAMYIKRNHVWLCGEWYTSWIWSWADRRVDKWHEANGR